MLASTLHSSLLLNVVSGQASSAFLLVLFLLRGCLATIQISHPLLSKATALLPSLGAMEGPGQHTLIKGFTSSQVFTQVLMAKHIPLQEPLKLRLLGTALTLRS